MNSSCTLQNKCRTCFQDNAALTTLFQTALNSETLLSSMLVEIASIKVSYFTYSLPFTPRKLVILTNNL